ncbi:MAG: ABC transporter permease, partial [Oscillospiraceae bacterium]|nr:ABC transporter permease [Oscillospiraceae bacterium]
KAVKTSIRDIIFENRDSEYRLSLPKTIVGAVFIAAGLVLGFAFKDLYLSSLAVLLLIVGSGLMIQFIVRKITWALAKFFGKRGMPVAELAATETGSKKPNSGNAVLAVSAVAAATAISIMASSILTALESPVYDTDIVISEASLKTDKYDYIEETEGVDDIEYLYRVSDNVSYDESVSFNPFEVLSLPDSTAYKAVGELPNELGKTEFIADRPAADKMGIGVGDSITLTFHSDGIFPIKKELTLTKVTDKTEFGSIGQIIISNDLYKDLFPDTVSAMLIRSSDPASLKAALEPTFTKGEKVQTMAEYDEESKQDSNVLTGGMLGVMIASVVLTLIGISGNQVIGFAARKKEYAMLHSCACSRSKIIRMILIENALLFGISCLMAAVICIPVSALISRIFILSQMGIYVDLEFSALFGCILILWIITMLTSLTPIKSLKKMNTAMELKYE